MRTALSIFILSIAVHTVLAGNGHDLWLRKTHSRPVNIICSRSSATLDIARLELQQGWMGHAGATVELKIVKDKQFKRDGFSLTTSGVNANTELGLLYGTFDLLRRQQTGELTVGVISNPSYERRILDHWDNLNGTIERGYAGHSIFWNRRTDSLRVTDSDRKLWQEYARANVSIGVNGSVLNNVNASPFVLNSVYLDKVKAIADIFRPYGIKTYLSINFSSPAIIGKLKTSDPLNIEVIQWWKDKVKEIYSLVPDFGGFLVKANSEGQPGPQDFGRTHADGANMLADVLKPYGGIVMWRAFVYSATDDDRAKQAFDEFIPLDGHFRDNVIIQVKNGPVDFQPREPFSPLFGAMKKTSLMPELQITQEYLGQSVHLVFLAPMWEEFLKSDTYQQGKGSSVARCTDGSIYSHPVTAIAGVANIGRDTNWCGHPFSQANWYAFGRLAWNNMLTSSQIADEWLRLTFQPIGKETESGMDTINWARNFLIPVENMMLESREAAVNYMMPLGLHHLFSANEHYGPAPWWAPADWRKDWTPPYYHQADTNGIGFDRTKSGSDAVSQYHESLCSEFNNVGTCPEIYLLWFHHLSWNYTMRSGHSLWEELCFHYDEGLQQVRNFQKVWDRMQPYVDGDQFALVQEKLRDQCRNAQVWKDACLLYFQQYSRQPIPYDLERPVYNLNELIKEDSQRH